MKILILGDFKELSPRLLQGGHAMTLDPEDDYDAILTNAQFCYMAPVDSGMPMIIRLLRKLSDMRIKNDFPEARFVYSNEEIIEQLESVNIGIAACHDTRLPGESALVAVYHGKGGTGATTTARAIAHGLARKGISTVLVDFDFRGPNIASYYKLGKKAHNYFSQGINEEVIRQSTVKTRFSSMAVLPLDVKDLDYSSMDGADLQLVCSLLRQRYQAIVIDTTIAAHKLPYMQSLLVAADKLLIVADQSKAVLDEIPNYSESLQGIGVSIQNTRLVINHYHSKGSSRKMIEKAYAKSKINKPQPTILVPTYAGDRLLLEAIEWKPAVDEIAGSIVNNVEPAPAKVSGKLRRLVSRSIRVPAPVSPEAMGLWGRSPEEIS